MSPVAIVGAAALGPHGLGWRGLGDLAERGLPSAATLLAATQSAATLLAATHPGTRGLEVPAIAPDDDVPPKALRLMSRAARFAAIVLREALREAGWTERAGVGYWLGVGASGGPLHELVAMLQLAREGDHVSLERLGREGLLASNPLQSFQVLNNFTMCHGAILEGTSGPNGALFSRGAGTVHALAEAIYAISDGDCARALAGGADTALHPVTWTELVRDGFAAGGLVPSEGAAVLALADAAVTAAPLAFVEFAGVGGPADAAAAHAPGADAELVVIAPWGEHARELLHARAYTGAGTREVIDATAQLGEALAATPALAWLVALDRIVSGRARSACVLSLGPDGELGTVVLRGPT